MRFGIAFLFMFSVALFAITTADVPLNENTEEYLERLEAFRCAKSTLRSIKPLSFANVRESLLLEDSSNCAAPEWLLKERELLIQPFLPNELKVGSIQHHSDKIVLGEIEASLNPMYPLRQGRTIENGFNFFSELFLNSHGGQEFGFAMALSPIWNVGFDVNSSAYSKIYFQEAYFKVGYHNSEFALGKEALGFGNSKHGNLLLSLGSKPFGHARFAIRPHQIEGPFQFLGQVTFQTWVAEQRSSFIDETWLWAIEFGLRPSWWFEFTFMELYQFGGLGSEKLSSLDYLKMFFGSSSPDLSSKRNRNFLTQVSFWLPNYLLKSYIQTLFESFSEWSRGYNGNIGLLIGLWLPAAEGLDFRFEYVRTGEGAYRHDFWRQGLSFHGNTLGHPIGTDGEAIYSDLGFPPVFDWRPRLGFSYQARTLNPSLGRMTERRYAVEFEAIKRFLQTEISISTQFNYVLNHSNVPQTKKTIGGIFGQLKYNFA